jgi:hypothetical protein
MMRAIRRRLALWTMAWLVCQVASLSVFIPRACCPAHDGHQRHVAVHGAETPGTPEESCTMRDAHGDACPMHRQAQRDSDCSMGPACKGPGPALATLFSHLGVPAQAAELTPDKPGQPVAVAVTPRPLDIQSFPDTPPPRA